MRIALYGDSMTEYLHRPPRVLTGHLEQIQADRHFEVFNYGIGATRAELVLYRLRYEFWHGRERMQPLPVLKPDVLVLESCAFNNANDQEGGLDNFRRIWDQIISSAQELAPQARVLLCLTIPCIPDVPDERANRLFYQAGPEIFHLRCGWKTRYQETFAQWAQQIRLPFVDIRSEVLRLEAMGTSRKQWIAADGVHPNPAGVDFISARIAAAIMQLPDPGNILETVP